LSTEDVLEGGLSRKYLSDECIKPPRRPSASDEPWVKCYLVVDREDKTKFRMYRQATKKFLLSAKFEERVGCFFISQYPDFPDLPSAEIFEAATSGGEPWFCCALVQQRNAEGEPASAYSLISRSCRWCDQRLGKYSCEDLSPRENESGSAAGAGPAASARHARPAGVHPAAAAVDGSAEDGGRITAAARCATEAAGALIGWASPRAASALLKSRRSCSESARLGFPAGQLRQRLATITHSLAKIDCGSEDAGVARRIGIRFPALVPDADAASVANERADGDASNDDDDRSRDPGPPSVDLMPAGWCSRQPRNEGNTLALSNLLPEWNRRMQSLCMKFVNGRVLMSSKKNFLVACRTSEASSGRGGGRLLSNPRMGRRCIQFGKVRFRRFNIDYRNPVSPVQAFAVALSMFRWRGGEEKEA
jgi:hypothetical protein